MGCGGVNMKGLEKLRDETNDRILDATFEDGLSFDDVDEHGEELSMAMLDRHLGAAENRDLQRHLRSLRSQLHKEKESSDSRRSR